MRREGHLQDGRPTLTVQPFGELRPVPFGKGGAATQGGYPAFTLIELLVVIAIIALLVSILTPSLKNARETARIVVCQTTLHGIGVTWVLYPHEHGDWLPVAAATTAWAGNPAEYPPDPSRYGGTPGDSWDYLLYPDTRTNGSGSQRMMFCPSDSVPREYNKPPRSYTMNAYLGYFQIGVVSDQRYWPKRAVQLRHPGETPVICEAWNFYNRYYPGQEYWYASVPPSQVYSSVLGLPGESLRYFDWDMHHFPVIYSGFNGMLYPQGGAGSNVLWADGHASFVNYENTPTEDSQWIPND